MAHQFSPDAPPPLSLVKKEEEEKKNVSRYLCSRGGQGKQRQIAWAFITKALLERDNSHTGLILVVAFLRLSSLTFSLPLPFFFLPPTLLPARFSLGAALLPSPIPSPFNRKPILERVCFSRFRLSFSITRSLWFSPALPSSSFYPSRCLRGGVHPSTDVRRVSPQVSSTRQPGQPECLWEALAHLCLHPCSLNL